MLSRSYILILSIIFSLASCKPEAKNNMTEDLFHQVIDRVAEIYIPVFEKRGAELVVRKHWEDGTLNAFASREGSQWFIDMFGGLARASHMTADALAFVVCHEIGHHEAGAPHYKSYGGQNLWPSVEGQADYFASTKCMKQYLSGKDNELYISELQKKQTIEAKLIQVCNEQYEYSEEQALCIRVSLAAKGFAMFQSSTTGQKEPNLNKKLNPTTFSDDGIFASHPSAICRYQGATNGSLCPKNFEAASIFLDPNEGFCEKANDPIGYRHHCWYNPTKISNAFTVSKVDDLPDCLKRHTKSLAQLSND